MSDDLKMIFILIVVIGFAICTVMMKKAPVMPDDYDYDSPKDKDNG